MNILFPKITVTIGERNDQLKDKFKWVQEQIGLLKDEKNKERIFEIFLRSIPCNITYDRNTIENANILFISNEPGLTGTYLLYESFIKDIDKIGLCGKCQNVNFNLLCDKLEQSFSDSMKSWLEISKHETHGKPNGENSAKIRHCSMKNHRKVGFFMNKKESNALSNCSIIVQDLFPYPQQNGYDTNPLNDKKNCNASQLRHIVDIFIRGCKGKKYIFIIGNRCVYEKNNRYLIRKNSCCKSLDNEGVIHSLLTYIYGNHCTRNLDIRISKNWPRSSNYSKKIILTPDPSTGNTINLNKLP